MLKECLEKSYSSLTELTLKEKTRLAKLEDIPERVKRGENMWAEG